MTSVLVCGPESSGVRLLYRVVATASTPKNGLFVTFRSIPHGRIWDLPSADVVIGISRSATATVRSAVCHGHARTTAEARERRARALIVLYRAVPRVLVTYEELVMSPEKVIETLRGVLPAAPFIPESLSNENAKWAW